MTIEQLRLFVNVVNVGSFSASARQLNLTQPTVSMSIKALERELDKKLLFRTQGSRSRLEMTEDGKQFLKFCTAVLNEYNTLLLNMQEQKSGVAFNVGVSETPNVTVMPPLLNEFKKLYPKIKFNVVPVSQGYDIFQMLREGRMDIGVTGIKRAPDDIDSVPFFFDPLVLVCPKRMHLSDGITIRKLRNLPLIIRGNVNTTDILASALQKNGYSLSDMNVVMQVHSNTDVLQAVSLNSGVGFVSKSLLFTQAVYNDRIDIVPVKNLDTNRNVSLVKLRNLETNQSMRLFWDFCFLEQWRKTYFPYSTTPK